MYNSKADLFDEISVRQIGSFLQLYFYFGLILLLQNAGTAQYVILYDIRYKITSKKSFLRVGSYILCFATYSSRILKKL